MKTHNVVAATLNDMGITRVFGLMGDHNMWYLTDFVDNYGGEFVSTTIESAAIGMADGYARATRRVSIASVTHGPALTNTLTALTETSRAGSPVVVITGGTADPNHLQHIETSAVASTAGVDFVRVLRPDDVQTALLSAVRGAGFSSRPVLLDIPSSIMSADATYTKQIADTAVGQSAVIPNADSLDQALGAIASSRRPVIVAGRGAVLSDAKDEIVRLADTIGAGLATSLLALDYFRGHSRNLGTVGTLAHDIATEAINQADCVIVFGAGLNARTTAEGSLLAGKYVVQCDNDPHHLERFYPVDAAVFGDAKEVAKAMADALGDLGLNNVVWAESLETKLSNFDMTLQFKDTSRPGAVDMRTAMVEVDRRLPADRVVVTDGGRFLFAPWRHLHVSHPNNFFSAVNFGAVGLGISVSIGVALARPQQNTVCIAGDGGAIMQIAELATAVRLGLPLLLIVLNDAAYGMEWTKFENLGLDPSPSRLVFPDFAEVAKAMGCRAARIDTLEQLTALSDDFWTPTDGPVVLDVRADPAIDPRSLT